MERGRRAMLAKGVMMAGMMTAALALTGCGRLVDARATARETAFEAQFPPTGQLLEVNGTTVHAHIEGTGPDLILLHGASGSSRDFTFDLVDRLKDRYRVIALDRPGLGWTDAIGDQTANPIAQAEVLRAAAGQLGVRDPIVLGHSYGGAVALAWGLRAPGDTAALVIVSGATMPWPGNLTGWYAFIGTPLGDRVGPPLLTALAPVALGDRIMAGIFAPQPVPPGYDDYIGVGLAVRRQNYRANAAQISGLRPYLRVMAPQYPRLTLPVEVVHGGQDRIVPASIHALPLAEALPDARLTILQDQGHMPQHGDPQAILDAIDRAADRARDRTERRQAP
ncbi:alpha/beta fold hydrolase [Paracoccus nototheniae]|uniref:Alpha/beta fold hydrolase n=1 Tax=Paracoccus nototheniae TaxID=2489002 RepID=A0ABW4DYW9_9RHOB|nr:alpha/beta hydrolase [Paracoccus nototheniae]